MSGVLSRIVEAKRVEIEQLRGKWDDDFTVRTIPLDVCAALQRPLGAPLRLIAEIKFRSPSAGELSRKMSVTDRARAYATNGATMISVLTDEPFFDGSWDDLERVRVEIDRNVRRDVPLLAKDFVLDEVQLTVARAKGADAILVIARILTPDRLEKLVRAALRRGVEPVVEIANEAELEAALATEARVIGVNARDLDTLAIDPARATRLVAAVPEGKIAVHLSGLKTPEAVRDVARGRADAALVGEALMREDDPTSLLRRFVASAAG